MSEIKDTFPTEEEPEQIAEPSADGAVEAEKPKTKQTSVARSAGIVSIAVMFSRVLGLIREQVFAYYFGAGFLNDAYQVAFRIPNVLRDLFAEGALSAAFVKVFTDYQINKSEKEAWRLASLVLNALAVVLSIIVIIGIIFSRQFVNLIADGFSPEKAALATTLTQIMFPFILLVALAAVAMGVLNTKGIFGIPASASTVFNITSIFLGIGLAYWLSGGGWVKSSDRNAIPEFNAQWAIIGMAVGTLIGGAAQFLMQLPSLLKVGFRFTPQISFTDEGVRRVMRLMTPAILGNERGADQCDGQYVFRFRHRRRHFVARLRVSSDAVSDRTFRRGNRNGERSDFIENGERGKIRRFSQHAFRFFEIGFSDDFAVRLRFDNFGRTDYSPVVFARRRVQRN